MPHSVSTSVAAHAIVTAGMSAIEDLRDSPPPDGVPPLPHRFLRHADEHTVVALRAVQEALAAAPALVAGRSRHAVVAAPCGAGRPAAARTLVQLRERGAVSVSPHVVPQCSLHAIASAVSVGLGMHGANIGVGGGPDALFEGCLTALSLAAEPDIATCWLVLTAWDSEPALDDRGNVPVEALCRAVVLALDGNASGRVRLSLRPGLPPAVALGGPWGTHDGSRQLAAFADALSAALDDRGLRREAPGRDPDCDGCLWSLRAGGGALLGLHALGRDRGADAPSREAA